jgi:hypothetical protein
MGNETWLKIDFINMPVTVHEIFTRFNIDIEGVVNWGNQIPETEAGIYIISTSEDPLQNSGILERPLFITEVINSWQAHSQNMRLNGHPTVDTERIIAELASHWHPHENILYIGKAMNLRQRVSYYYNHIVGHNSPHRGGFWLKTLLNFHNFFVYYGTHNNPLVLEAAMLKYFVERNAEQPWDEINNPCRYIPFANLEIKAEDFKGRKNHNLRSATW